METVEIHLNSRTVIKRGLFTEDALTLRQQRTRNGRRAKAVLPKSVVKENRACRRDAAAPLALKHATDRKIYYFKHFPLSWKNVNNSCC